MAVNVLSWLWGVPNEPLDSLTEEWVRGFAELTAKRTGMGLWTRRLNRVRTRTHGGIGRGRRATAANADQITMSPTINQVVTTKRTFHCPCRFRAVSAALHGTSCVRSHLPQANYIKLR